MTQIIKCFSTVFFLSFSVFPAGETCIPGHKGDFLLFLCCVRPLFKFSFMWQLAPRLPPGEKKKAQEKHRGLFWSWPLLAVRQLLSLLNRKQQQQSAENDVACIHHTRSIYKSVYRCRADTIRVIIYVIYCASALINRASNTSFGALLLK